MIYSLTGDDVIDFGTTCPADVLTACLADGTCGELTVPNDLINMQLGKNGNGIYAKDENGRRFDLTIRVLRGSEADQRLRAKFQSWITNFAEQTFIFGSIVKKLGDGLGNVKEDTYSLAGMFIRKPPSITTNVNGDIEQSVTVFELSGVIDDCTIG